MKKLVLGLVSALMTVNAALASPITLTPVLNPSTGSLTVGLSTESGSSNVTHTQAGFFVDEFLVPLTGSAWVNATLDTSAALELWSQQGISFVRATFRDAAGNDLPGAELLLDGFEFDGTVFNSAFSAAPVLLSGDFILIVEAYAGDEMSFRTSDRNSFSYSGLINMTPITVPEPASVALVLAALGGAAWARRRQAKR